MTMHNPPHPGEFIQEVYMKPFGLSGRFLAEKLGVSASTLNRIIKKQSSVTPEMALRLAKAVVRTPESWLAMQDNHDLWQLRQSLNLSDVHKVEFSNEKQLATL